MNKRLQFLTALSAVLLITAVGLSAQNYKRMSFGQSELARVNASAYFNDGPSAYLYSRYSFIDAKTYGEDPLDLAAGFGLTTKWGLLSFEITHDGYSNFDRHAMQLNYGYGWDFGNAGRFSFSAGLALPVDVIHWDVMEYRGGHSGTSTCVTPDMNLSFEYAWGPFRAGLAALNIFGGSVGPRDFRIGRNPLVVMAHLFYNARMTDDNWGVSPYITVGYCEQIAFDLGVYFDWRKLVSFGYSIRAITMEHMVNVNVAIPRTFLDLNLAYTHNMFNSQQTLSFGLKFRLPDLRCDGEKRHYRTSL